MSFLLIIVHADIFAGRSKAATITIIPPLAPASRLEILFANEVEDRRMRTRR